MLPNNWRWLKQSDICTFNNGQKLSNVSLPYINVKYLRGISKAKIVDSGNFVEKDSLIILVDGENSGEVFVVPENGYMGSTFRLLKPSDDVNIQFLKYFIMSKRNVYKSKKRGSIIPHLDKKLFNDMPFPLPPLDEQKRIVDIIDRLFEKLNSSRTLAQKVVDNYELQRSKILYEAFTGQLTNSDFDSWKEYNLQSVCSIKITDGTHQTPTYCEKDVGIPFLSSKDVKYGYIDWTDIKYISQDLHEELYKRISPQIDDILLAKNGTTGIAAIVDVDKVFDIYVTLALLRPNKNIILPRYLLNIINSPICKLQFNERLTGITLPNLHLRDIKTVLIKLPSIEEQKEIVRYLDSLLTKGKRTKELAESVLRNIEMMKKKILGMAFRGEFKL